MKTSMPPSLGLSLITVCASIVVLGCERSGGSAATTPAVPPAANEMQEVQPLPALPQSDTERVPSGERPLRERGSGMDPRMLGKPVYLQYAVLDLEPVNQPQAADNRDRPKHMRDIRDTRDIKATDPTPSSKRQAAAEARVDAVENISGDDRNFIQRIGNDGQAEEQAALYVASKTTNDEIRAYAARMGRDHGKANARLRELAAQRSIEIPSDPEGLLRTKLDRLRGLGGAQMEQAFLEDFAVQAHMDAIALFEVQKAQAKDKGLQDFATEQLPTLREHYRQGQLLQKKYAPQRSSRLQM